MSQTATPRPARSLQAAARGLAASLVVVALGAWTTASAYATVRVVSKTKSGANIYSTIQGAVNVAKPSDWVLIEPGKYDEPVLVETPGLHIRGLNRNTVIVDGLHETSTQGLNGIEVFKTSHVSIENLTVRNFDRASRNGGNGNEIWWNGGDGSGVIGAEGWHGAYLTAYDSGEGSEGLLGGYGLFVSNSIKGSMENVYASGFNDSGLYVGACQDCRAVISHALSERNALGYSGTNSGG